MILLEPGLVEAVALDVGHRDDVGGPRLAGHEAHLAEDGGRLDRRDEAPLLLVLELRADLGPAADENVEPVRDRPLPGDRLALGERGVDEVVR